MRKTIFILEAINALLGIFINLQNLNWLGLSIENWNTIVFLVFVGGFVVLFWSDGELERRIYDNVMARIADDFSSSNTPNGTLDSVTEQDRILIGIFAKNMAREHGHLDFEGLLADRASGVPLNELMVRNCSKCNHPRNQKSESTNRHSFDDR